MDAIPVASSRDLRCVAHDAARRRTSPAPYPSLFPAAARARRRTIVDAAAGHCHCHCPPARAGSRRGCHVRHRPRRPRRARDEEAAVVPLEEAPRGSGPCLPLLHSQFQLQLQWPPRRRHRSPNGRSQVGVPPGPAQPPPRPPRSAISLPPSRDRQFSPAA
jgi:hypothetical protein